MTQIGSNGNPFVQQISQKMGEFGKDGRITRSESKDLKEWISQSGLPAEEQTELTEMVDALEDATNNSFLFFKWKSDISPSEMRNLQGLAEKNNLAAQLLEEFSDASKVMPTSDRSSFGRFMDSIFEPGQVKFNPGQQAQAPEDLPGDTPAAAPASATSGQRNAGAPVASQFFNPDGTRSATGRADCGPTSALMILQERGYNPQVSKYTDMRELIPASRRGASATTRDDLLTMMSHYSGGKIQRAAADKGFSVGQSRGLIEHARQQLAQGNSVIMLNGGFSGTKGHYTVIKAVNDDGSIQVADPGTGRMRTISAEQLEFAMRSRQNGGRGQAYLMSLTG